MSGKIAANSGYVTKADFTRLQSKVDAIVSKLESAREVRSHPPSTVSTPVISNRKLSGGVKAWLTSKTGLSSPGPQRYSFDAGCSCPNCGRSVSAGERGYDDLSDVRRHIFQKRGNDEVPGRNDNQRCLKNEFNQFQADVNREIKSLQKSVREVQALYESLERSVHESLTNLQIAVDKINAQLVANTACLDQLGCQTRQRTSSTTSNILNNNQINPVGHHPGSGQGHSRRPSNGKW